MPVTVIVEPNPVGHRFQSAALVVERAVRDGDVVLLTCVGGRQSAEFAAYLAGLRVDVREVFTEYLPPTRMLARAVADTCREMDVSRALVMDADQALKRWWLVAFQEFRGLGRRRPRVLFMLTRYPAAVGLTDWFGWKLRPSKASLVLLAMASGTLHHVAGFTGRADATRGWLVKRARDPAICTAHSRDRAKIRADWGLPPDRPLIGLFGVLTERKMAPFVLESVEAGTSDGQLLLAGEMAPTVRAWFDALPADRRARAIAFDQYLTNAELDRAVAAVEVVAIALTNNGPSGLMGKALAAEVPVVSAGSLVRARELAGTHGGEVAELTVSSFAAAISRALATGTRPNPLPLATGEEYAECLLGIAHNRLSDRE